MGCQQRIDCLADQAIGHHQLNFPFGQLFQRAGVADERPAAGQRAKLPQPKALPAAILIIANSAATGRKNSLFGQLQVAFRHMETQLVDAASPLLLQRYRFQQLGSDHPLTGNPAIGRRTLARMTGKVVGIIDFDQPETGQKAFCPLEVIRQ